MFHVSLFQPQYLKLIHKKLQAILFLKLLMKLQSDAQNKSYDNFPQVTCLECNSGVCKNPNFLRSYLHKYNETNFEIWTRCLECFWIKWVFFVASKTSQTKICRENSMMTFLEQQNPKVQSSDTKCYETSSQKDRKDRSTPQNSTSQRGKPPLRYTNEQFFDDSNKKTSFLYIRV